MLNLPYNNLVFSPSHLEERLPRRHSEQKSKEKSYRMVHLFAVRIRIGMRLANGVHRKYAVAKVESMLLRGARAFFDRGGYDEISVPHLTKATGSCENMDTLFGLDYFGANVFLMQTGQLFLESLIPPFERLWCVGPSFRAEPVADDRHLTEFTLLEMEFHGDFEELLRTIEGFLGRLIEEVKMNDPFPGKTVGIDIQRLDNCRPPFEKITYDKAIELLNLAWGQDLKSPHEMHLIDHMGGKPLFITHFPERMKFFDMKRNTKNPNVVDSADLILPFCGEAVGAAERESDHHLAREKLLASDMFRQLTQRGGEESDFSWFFDHLKEHPGYSRAGCGVGLSRVTQFILGCDSILDATVFPVNRERVM